MKNESFSRRRFLRSATAAAVAAGLSALATTWAQPAAKPPGLVRLGGPLSRPEGPRRTRPGTPETRLPSGLLPRHLGENGNGIRDVSRAFAKHDVVLAEVGGGATLMILDPAKRAISFRNVTEGLALAEAVGYLVNGVDIAGSFI